MTGSRKVLLALAAVGVTAYFLPVTRDELSWWWAESHNHSDNYFRYLTDWPKGRHVVEAKLDCIERQRAESIKIDMLHASPTDPGAEAAYSRELATRQDNFSWKRATVLDTSASYHDYLKKFPKGLHAASARQKIKSLGQPTSVSSH